MQVQFYSILGEPGKGNLPRLRMVADDRDQNREGIVALLTYGRRPGRYRCGE